MNLALVAFVVATVAVARLPTLPAAPILAVLCLLAVLLLAGRWRAPAALMTGIALGAIYATAFASSRLETRLPTPLAGSDLRLTGTIDSVPERAGRVQQFRFSLDQCRDCWSPGATVVLSVYDPTLDIRAGERWAFTVRLERPRGTVNPGLFDYDGWLLAEDISARGYVRDSPAPQRWAPAGPGSGLLQLRAAVWRNIEAAVPDSSLAGLMVALTIGESGAIGDVNWRKLSATGTNHLLIISGLHVGLIAGAGFRLARLLGAGQQVAGMLALLGASGYGFVAGMGLPVQRSLVMTAVALSGVLFARQIPPSSLFCVALAAVTLLNPLASLSSGFWLSFGAVFVLLFAFGACSRPGTTSPVTWLQDLLRSQWIVFAGTMPVLAVTVSQISAVAMVANLVAIPWVSLLVIPPLLLALVFVPVSTGIASALFVAASHSLNAIWIFIERLAALEGVAVFSHVSWLALVCALTGSLLMLAPRGVLPRWPGLLMWLPLVYPASQSDREMLVYAIDVGQGLAVLVRTPDHTLLYDAGPRFGERFDAGERIVTPLLRRQGVRTQIDTFVVSHGDIDHAGGADAIRRNFLVKTMISSDGTTARDCRRRDQQRFGRTIIAIMPVSIEGSDNDRSCVVLVTYHFPDGVISVLLPGDIERAGEHRMKDVPLPPVDLMFAPHHGSLSSSTPMFLNHVSPGIAVVSAGYRNRFGHPDPVVLERYHRRGIRVFNTATSGAVAFRWQSANALEISEGRIAARRFWYD